MAGKWHIELLGHLTVRYGLVAQGRFYSHKVALLLAWLAYHPQRRFAREEIIEFLWPDTPLRSGRASLRQVLAMLRRQLEPTGTPFGVVLMADYTHIGLNPVAFTTDVMEFESRLDQAVASHDLIERMSLLQSAIECYTGDLLPGFYEDWVLCERERLAQRLRGALVRLRETAEMQGETYVALNAAWRLVRIEPASEEANMALMRLLTESGQQSIAQQHYSSFWNAVVAETDSTPTAATQAQIQRWNLHSPSTDALASSLSARPSAVVSSTGEKEGASQDEAKWDRPSVFVTAIEARTHLPLLLTPTFGRDTEILRLSALLRQPSVRLVTVSGMGGVGKTRLALETAWALEFPGRCLFISLAEVGQVAGLPEHLLRALFRSPQSGVPIEEQLVSALAGEPFLLLLDNFEHLVEGGAELVHLLLTRLPALKCLITSRLRLNLDGEHEFPVATLPLPDTRMDLEELGRCASVQLLVERARAVRPEFQMTARNAAAIRRICTQLEGLPLAIELAAARVSVVSVTQMPAELERKLTFLVGRKRNVATRHRSMRAMLDWSFQLLSTPERLLFESLSVFRGGWNLEAIRDISQDEQVLEKLESLLACSLLTTEEGNAGIRYGMLEIVCEYARERLEQSGRAEAVTYSHYTYFTQLAETASARLSAGQEISLWLDRLEQEMANLRQALTWCRLQSSEYGMRHGMRLAIALLPFWEQRGYLEEGYNWFDLFLLNSSAGDATLYVRALLGKGRLATEQGNLGQGLLGFQKALDLARSRALPRETAEALCELGRTCEYQGNYEQAHQLLSESLAISRDLGEFDQMAKILVSIGNTYFMQRKFDLCMPLYEESIALYTRLGNADRVMLVRSNLSLVRMEQGDYAGALHDIQIVIEERRKRRSRSEMAINLNNLANVYIHMRDWEAARQALDEGLEICREQKNPRNIVILLGSYIHSLYRQGRFLEAEPYAREMFRLDRSFQVGNHRIVWNALETLAQAMGAREEWVRAAWMYGALEALGSNEVVVESIKEDPAWEPEHYRELGKSIRIAVDESTWERLQQETQGISWEQVLALVVDSASPG